MSPDALGEMPLESPASLIVCESCFWNSLLLWCGFVELCLPPRLSCLLSGLVLPMGWALFLADRDGRCANSLDSLALAADWALELVKPG